MATVDSNFWKNKRVFLTGHTGFKGSWLSLWLQYMGATIRGFALDPPTTPSLFRIANVSEAMESVIGNIQDPLTLTKSLIEFKPDILIHMAAQSLVRYSYSSPVETYKTNVIGTVNVLEAARQCHSLKCIINVTSDKCYENREWEWGYREIEPLGGLDPYSSSKGCSELVTSAYRHSFFGDPHNPAVATARAGNVVGGGDWAQDRLVPDILNAFEKGQAVTIRNPKSIRPWQHVLEPLSGYLVLAQHLFNQGGSYAEAWNFGPLDEDSRTVEWILNKLAQLWGNEASYKFDQTTQPHEAHSLKLDISKARLKLDWTPTWPLQTTLRNIVDWHQAWLDGADMNQHCLQDVQSYIADMSKK